MVFSPPPAAPTRWRLDEKGSTSYHDLLLQWSHHEHLTELSRGRATFQQARADIYPLAYASSVLELDHSHNEQQVRAAAERALLSSRYTAAHIAEQLGIILAHLRPIPPPPAAVPPPFSGTATDRDLAPAAPDGGRANTDGEACADLDSTPDTRVTESLDVVVAYV